MAHKTIPVATYRLQFSCHFTFKDASEIVEYLHELGISHCYSSPIFKAKPGSGHGYDIVDHSIINPEIGTEGEFEALIGAIKGRSMGLILDIVPNHMYIFDSSNKWWQDVLENGPASAFADYFDIDWKPPRKQLKNKVLLPVLDQQYGDALENQMIKATYREGCFYVEPPAMIFPTDPSSWNQILEPLAKEAQEILQEGDPDLLELQSIVTALHYLPPAAAIDKDQIAERQREKEVVKRRLAALIEQSDAIKELLNKHLKSFNGLKGDPRSFDGLEGFVNSQPYRLCYWRVANDEINYRRFFDILELAGITTNKPEVFEAIHSLVSDLIRRNLIDGIRIDHIDGLWDPEQYLLDLQKLCKQARHLGVGSSPESSQSQTLYIIAEKILTGSEKLLADWHLDGTVGYDFLNQVNGLYVFQQNKKALINTYQNFTDLRISAFDLMYTCKRLILGVSMSSELHVLARHLDTISEQDRKSRDFTAESLKSALREVIACFPVYRSYIRACIGKIHEEDHQYILTAILRAKRKNPAMSASIFDFIQNVLLLQHPPELEPALIAERENFVMRFQQLTSPVMAKGAEDTAFYRYYPLSSLREVGIDLLNFGTSVEGFHKKNQERLEFWPRSMNTTSTHDTKRSEDVRARINVLSEIPEEWEQSLQRWSKLNQPLKVVDGDEYIPDANEEYLLYQTLAGTWPHAPMSQDEHLEYVKRILRYMEKAIKEAKIHSSWINPNKEYDQQVRQFIEKALQDSKDNIFLEDFKTFFFTKISAAGMLNSLSQALLKIMSPGIPDIYQGNEIWDLSLVDPDNRRPVDFKLRKSLLENLQAMIKKGPMDLVLDQLIQSPENGMIKLYITRQALLVRQKYPELFFNGTYLPMEIKGSKQNHAVAFSWTLGNKSLIIVAGRFFTFLMQNSTPSIEPAIWDGTQLIFPAVMAEGKYRNIFTGKELTVQSKQGEPALDLNTLLSPFPAALLERIEG